MPQNLTQLYRILGLTERASEKEIKEAWKILAYELHPDRNQGESRRVLAAHHAYDEIMASRAWRPTAAYGYTAPSATRPDPRPHSLATTKFMPTPPNPRYRAEQQELERRYGGLGEWARDGLLREKRGGGS